MVDMYPKVEDFLRQRLTESDLIEPERVEQLHQLAAYIAECSRDSKPVQLTFICTHNSRRSHLAQIWAKIAADFLGLNHIQTFSGGTEVTAMNDRIVECLRGAGLLVDTQDVDSTNPHYLVSYSRHAAPLHCFSKIHDQAPNPKVDYCAVMTCTSADLACPVVAGCDLRLAIAYEDPKQADGLPSETSVYDKRSKQVCREMLLAMSIAKKHL
jgi:arsenate reductase